jgi:GntP family gluconate:H+ symporter
MIVVHTTIAILAVVLLIMALKVDPIISLITGSLYLGLASGLGFEATLAAIVDGFGSIMAEVGLLIGFGVLIGSLLFAMRALQRLVGLLLDGLGARRLPYAMAAVMTALFPSIYVDVQLVLAAPLARQAAPRLGPRGLGIMAGALTTGILVGYVFVVPGLGTISIAGLLGVPLAQMLGYGLLIGVATAVLTVFLYRRLVAAGFWNPGRDEVDPAELPRTGQDTGTDDDDAPAPGSGRIPSLPVSLLPVLVPLLLIAFGAVAEAAGFSTPFIAFLGDPALALFVGLVGAYALAKATIGGAATDSAMGRGLATTGQILLITGVGGSLGAVIGETDLDGVLAGLFSADAASPVVVSILVAWLIAAVLHLAIGSISVAAITAAGIIGPILAQLDVQPLIIGLAIGAGSLFALHVNSNFFWMFQALLGVTTRGALKALTFVTALASVVALPLIVVLGLVV